jgi:hypothetical protein
MSLAAFSPRGKARSTCCIGVRESAWKLLSLLEIELRPSTDQVDVTVIILTCRLGRVLVQISTVIQTDNILTNVLMVYLSVPRQK